MKTLLLASLAVLASLTHAGCTAGGEEPAHDEARAGVHRDDAVPVSGTARPTAGPLRVVVLSDLNGSYGATSYGEAVHDAVERTVGLRPDLVLSTGDMVAGQKAGLDYEAMWRGFHAAVTSPLAAAGIPFAPTPGNHDASGYAAFAGERSIYVSQWQARRPAIDWIDGAGYPLRYSFARGPALFVSLDATTIGKVPAEQKEWVERQLEVGADFPVKIVYGHVPLYAFTQGRETEVMNDPDFERMLVRRGVTMFVSGHHHGYYPGKRPNIRLVSTSCLGDSPRKLIGSSTASPRSLLVLDLDETGVRSLEAYAAPAYTAPVERSSLPESLSHAGNTIVRDDR